MINDNTLYYIRCYKLAKDKGINNVKELILYLKTNKEVNTSTYDLDRYEMLEISERALWTYENDVSIKQMFDKK